MMREVTAELRRGGLDCKKDVMEFMAWGAGNGMGGGNMKFEHEGQGYEVCDVESIKAMES